MLQMKLLRWQTALSGFKMPQMIHSTRKWSQCCHSTWFYAIPKTSVIKILRLLSHYLGRVIHWPPLRFPRCKKYGKVQRPGAPSDAMATRSHSSCATIKEEGIASRNHQLCYLASLDRGAILKPLRKWWDKIWSLGCNWSPSLLTIKVISKLCDLTSWGLS